MTLALEQFWANMDRNRFSSSIPVSVTKDSHSLIPPSIRHVLIGGVCIDDGRLGQQVRKFLAAVSVLLDDLDVDAGLQKLLGQIEGNRAAADDHAVPYAAALEADPGDEITGILSGRHDTDDVARLQHEGAVRDLDVIAALHGAHQDVRTGPLVDLGQRAAAAGQSPPGSVL